MILGLFGMGVYVEAKNRYGWQAAYPQKNAVVDLTQAQKLQYLAALWVHIIDTPDSHDESQLALRLHIIAILGLSRPP